MSAFVLKDSITGSMTDAEFLRFCHENQNLRVERNNNLEVIIMSPVSTLSGLHSSEIFLQLASWAKQDGRGLAFDSSTGFTLPDRSVFSPDASWVSKEKWNLLTDEDKNRFAPICPEFVIEVRSNSDSLEELKKKMNSWISNKAQLSWLIDPIEKKSFIFQSDGTTNEIEGFDKKIIGVKPVEGFELDLSALEI